MHIVPRPRSYPAAVAVFFVLAPLGKSKAPKGVHPLERGSRRGGFLAGVRAACVSWCLAAVCGLACAAPAAFGEPAAGEVGLVAVERFSGYGDLFERIAERELVAMGRIDAATPERVLKLATESSISFDRVDDAIFGVVETHYHVWSGGRPYDALRGATGNGLYYVVRRLGGDGADGEMELVGRAWGRGYRWQTENGTPVFVVTNRLSAEENPETFYRWDGAVFRAADSNARPGAKGAKTSPRGRATPQKESDSPAPLRSLEVLAEPPAGRPFVRVFGFCRKPGYVVWDEALRLAEVEAAAEFYRPEGVVFAVVQIYREPDARWIFEESFVDRDGKPRKERRVPPRLLPGDRVVAAEMVF